MYWQESSRVHSLRDSSGYVPKAHIWSVRVQRGYGTLSNTAAPSSQPEHRSKLGQQLRVGQALLTFLLLTFLPQVNTDAMDQIRVKPVRWVTFRGEGDSSEERRVAKPGDPVGPDKKLR